MNVNCYHCHTQFKRTCSRYNEAIKFGWRQFCSLTCQALAKNKSTRCICSNQSCRKLFFRKNSQVKLSNLQFCSKKCSARYYGQITRSEHAHTCELYGCNKIVTSNYAGKKFCSPECLNQYQHLSLYSKDSVLVEIKKFFLEKGRIPTKHELQYLYKPARKFFKTWNNAIVSAGFDPNPVMFSKHYVAKDGHKCDSMAERIVDDWLSRRNIDHQTHLEYPWKNRMKCDFKVGNIWIEVFGLTGQNKKYDLLKKEKLRLIRQHGLSLITLTLKDVYSGNLDSKLTCLISRLHHPS